MRRFLGGAMLVIVVAAAVGAAFGDVPSRVPAWALHDAIIWRVEKWVVLVVALDAVLTLVALAFHGWLFTGLNAGPAGGQAQPVTDTEQTGALDELRGGVDELRTAVGEGVSSLASRMTAVEEQLDIDPDDDGPRDDPQA
jgi:hypothetical protein